MFELGHTRSVYRHDHLLLTPDTFVRAPLPGMRKANAIIHVAPAVGARFTQFTAEFEEGGVMSPAAEQRFLYVIDGELQINDQPLAAGDFAYVPAGGKLTVTARHASRAAVIEKDYQQLEDVPAPAFFTGREGRVSAEPLEGDTSLEVRHLVPDNPSFDFAVNTMTYQPGLAHELETLGGISEAPPPVTTRVVFTEADLLGRAFVKQLCREAGLVVREDPVGNAFARWVGTEPGLPAVGTGSHIDAIPNAGRYDGTVGVLGGLEAIRALQRSGFRPRRSIELLTFTSEEPTRFGIGCLGSRLLGGLLNPSVAEQLKDKNGTTLNEARTQAGFTGPLSEVCLPKDYYSAFVELHIEQGPILEARQLEIGVVTAIAAPASLRIWIEGE